MQFFAAFSWHESRKHFLCVVVLGSGSDQTDSTQDSVGVGIDGKNVKAEAVHHHAKCRLRPDARQPPQRGIGFFRREASKLAGRACAEIGKQF